MTSLKTYDSEKQTLENDSEKQHLEHGLPWKGSIEKEQFWKGEQLKKGKSEQEQSEQGQFSKGHIWKRTVLKRTRTWKRTILKMDECGKGQFWKENI